MPAELSHGFSSESDDDGPPIAQSMQTLQLGPPHHLIGPAGATGGGATQPVQPGLLPSAADQAQTIATLQAVRQ